MDTPVSEAPQQTVLYRRKVTLPADEAAAGDIPVFEKNEEQNQSLGGWLEKQLMPQSGLEGLHEIRAWTGWVFDRDCVGITPVRHTKACNLMGSCYDSGLGIFEYVPAKPLMPIPRLKPFYALTAPARSLPPRF